MNGGASASFWQASWRRLRKNRSAMAGLLLILFAVLLAIFGYLIAPDSSPFANRIILEIGGEKPGFTQQFLQVKKSGQQASVSFLSRIAEGKKDEVDFIPITSYKTKGDSLIAEKYIDEGLTDRIAYASSSLAKEPVVNKRFFLGTDKYGRDILSRLIIGTRVSLSVGLITVLISLSLGIFLGAWPVISKAAPTISSCG
jgi:ABC-type dipeptide/oligopeptide/nickel transport system permease subunit